MSDAAEDGLREADGDEPVAPTADRLLDTAAALFRREGYARSTTRELAELLGIQKASLYYHTKSKEDLLYSLCLESLKRLQEQVGVVAETATPETRLREMIVTHVEGALRDRDMHTVMLIELRSLSPARRRTVIERRSAYQRLLQDAIAADQAAGRIRDDIDAEYIVLVLLNLLNWTIFWFRTDGPLTARAVADLLTTIFIEGAGSGLTAQHLPLPLALGAAMGLHDPTNPASAEGA